MSDVLGPSRATAGLYGVEPLLPLDGDLVPPEPVAVEGREAVHHDRDRQDQGEDPEDGAHRTHKFARARLRGFRA